MPMPTLRIHECKLIHTEFEPLRVGRKFAVIVPASTTLKVNDYFLFLESDSAGRLLGDDCVFRISWIETTPPVRAGHALVSLIEASIMEASLVRDGEAFVTLERELASRT